MAKTTDKRERTFTGCWSCRLKKRRCDLGKPVCSLCTRHGLTCSYEVRLIWSKENIFLTKDKDIVDVLQFDKSRKRVSKSNRVGLSKKQFKEIIHLDNHVTTPRRNHTDHEDESFTISVRRFQVYDNEVKSVFGPKGKRDHNQKVIDSKLNRLLEDLYHDNEEDNITIIDKKQGPFHVFSRIPPVTTFPSDLPLDDLSETFDDEITLNSSNSHFDSPIFSPMSTLSHDTIIDSHLDDSYHSFSKQMYLDDADTQQILSLSDEIHEETTFNILLTHCTNNMILSRLEYSTWFMTHIKQLCDSNQSSKKLIEGMLMDSHLLGEEKYVNKLLLQENDNKINHDLQIVGLTIISVLHGFYNDLEFFHDLEEWLLKQESIKYSMYPLINFIISKSDSCDIFNHCHYLLNITFTETEDSYQEGLTFELDNLITERLVGKWKDKISLQLNNDEDITESSTQLKYWQSQSKCNEQFYKDINQITESSIIQTI